MKSYAVSLSLCLCLVILLSNGSCEKFAGEKGSNPAFSYVAEGRGTWIGRRTGVNWDSTMAALKAAGFNMVFPNMCTGGAANYPSELLPMTSERDELKLCIEAAHKYGIEVHVWRINWYMSGCPDSFTVEMEKAGRIQYSWDGKRNPQVMREQGYRQDRDWLCPSHPENRKLEFDAMLELVQKYDVDGVHFDYMRYGTDQMCYCSVCKERFEEETGLNISNWPADVWKEGKYREIYLDWRRNLIHSSAREIARAVHTSDSYVCVSLAARTGVEWAYYSDAQVWWAWISEGILDFVCPMNYTTEPDRFAERMKSHLPLVKGAVPYYSGMGIYQMKAFAPFKEIVEIGRGLGQDGFVTFELRALLPELEKIGAELTELPALLPHRAPEIRFILEKAERETEEGFPVFSAAAPVECKVNVMFKGKLREGIRRIKGDIILQTAGGETINRIQPLNLEKSSIVKLSARCEKQGRFRIAFYGTMTLSSGEVKPFISKSFPFEISPS